MSGWIKLHRKITEWEWYSDANTFRVFMHLLLTANYEDKRWRNIDVKRGQIITGRMELAQTLRLSERQIRTALDKLKMSGVITIKTTNQYSLITVENYSCFQDFSTENVQPKAQQPTNQKSAESPINDQTRVRPMSTTQEEKNLKLKYPHYIRIFYQKFSRTGYFKENELCGFVEIQGDSIMSVVDMLNKNTKL